MLIFNLKLITIIEIWIVSLCGFILPQIAINFSLLQQRRLYSISPLLKLKMIFGLVTIPERLLLQDSKVRSLSVEVINTNILESDSFLIIKSFSTGIILGVSMIHLIPDAAEGLDNLVEFPLAMTLVVFGITLMVGLESLFLYFLVKIDPNAELHPHSHPHHHNRLSSMASRASVSYPSIQLRASLAEANKLYNQQLFHDHDHHNQQRSSYVHLPQQDDHGHGHDHGGHNSDHDHSSTSYSTGLDHGHDHGHDTNHDHDCCQHQPQSEKETDSMRNSLLDHDHGHDHDHIHVNAAIDNSHLHYAVRQYSVPVAATSPPYDDHDHDHDVVPSLSMKQRVLKSFIMEISIAVHSIIVGFDVGLLGTGDESTLHALMFALAFHQFFEGISLGISIVESSLGTKYFLIFCICFSLSMPGGIIVGLFCIENSTIDTVKAIATSIAAGSLVYTSLVEMLADDFGSIPPERQVLKVKMYFAFLFGCFSMALLAVWA